MRKGSYSEELVRVVVAMNTKEIDAPTALLEASRRKIYLSKTACKIPKTLPHECEVALLLHNEAAVPVAGLALRGSPATLPQNGNCKSLPWDFTTKSQEMQALSSRQAWPGSQTLHQWSLRHPEP